MGIVKAAEIRGVRDESGNIYCSKCMGDLKDLGEDDYILEYEIEHTDDLYFCDECKEPL